jgi:two-component system sensor histidine kinase CpxA
MGTLAKTFNQMAHSLEKMVRGGRELTANLSHELRSPLARIRVCQQMIQERLESGRTDGVNKHVLKMEEEINHMDSLIDKIMKLSKLDLQEPPPRDDIVSMSDMLDEAVERITPLIGKSGILVKRDIETVPNYCCRKQDIRIVLDNILSNAVKYSPDGDVVHIECNAEDDAVTIRVVNSYGRLSRAELETIFTPFKRLGYDDIEGNGLGLAFARKIIEDHGGTIQASSIDRGFCLTIRLPLG